MKFQMTALKLVKRKMDANNVTKVTFPFEYNGKPFSCIFIIDIQPYRLYLSTLGCNPITLEFEIEKYFKIDTYIDSYKYQALLSYLELRYDPNNKFKPISLFSALNNELPRIKLCKVKVSTILKIAARTRKIEESEKIYFMGWKHLPKGQMVSPENIEKTRSAFGDDIANVCLANVISSCWSSIPKDEKLPDFTKIYK